MDPRRSRAHRRPRIVATASCAWMLSRFLTRDDERLDPRVLAKRHRHVAGDVLDERRVLVGLHRHVTLVRALEQRVDRRRRGTFGGIDEILDPHRRAVGAHDIDVDVAALVVGAVVADLLAARAEARHRDLDADANRDVVPSLGVQASACTRLEPIRP